MDAKFVVVGALLSVALRPSPSSGHRGYGRTTPNPTELREPDTRGYDNYFQEIYMVRPSPELIEFGHVCENDDEWEQRYEKKDFDRNRHQGKVRWADRRGGQGEHYWDYNHAGKSDDHQTTVAPTTTTTTTTTTTAAEVPADPPKAAASADDNPVRQHRKRELDHEDHEGGIWPREAEAFVDGFNREIGVVFKVDLAGRHRVRY